MKPTLDKMPKLTRYQQQQAERDKQKKNISKLIKIGSKPACAVPEVNIGAAADPLAPAAIPEQQALALPATPPQKLIQAGDSRLLYYARAEASQELHLQPWSADLVSTLLSAAEEGGTHLCLTWPVKLESLALLHGLATLERNFASDLKGLRTLMFPGTYATRAALHTVLVNRTQFSDRYRSFWDTSKSENKFQSMRRSTSFEAMLAALNDIRNWHSEVTNPSLGELVPTFIYEPKLREWASVAASPLERSLSKVTKLAHRKSIRDKVNSEWGTAQRAPGALMVIHNNARKEVWKQALSSPQLKGDASPDLFLLDASSTAETSSYNAVKRIPEFLRYAHDNGFASKGAVVVTDDPKTFFVMRARLQSLGFPVQTHVWAAEADQPIFSATALAKDWKPEVKSNANFSVAIVDRDASSVALTFQRLAHAAGGEDSIGHKALMAVCLYVLRLSNLPAGYKDLGVDFTESGGETFSNQHNAWTPLSLEVQAALSSGELNENRAEVERALKKANQLIDDWTDATPMALKLLAEVKKHPSHGHGGLSIVLPSQKYIRLAHYFLQRKLGSDWAGVQERLDWHTLSSIGKTLSVGRTGWGVIFVGINRSVLRLLLAHPEIPHGTAILVAYRQAESTVATLKSMQTVEAFKPYRGRMGLLVQELERRLREVPNPLNIGRLAEASLTFTLEDNHNGPSSSGAPGYFRFELESGESAYSAGWVYRFSPDEDPCFRRAAASSVQAGDLIFVMGDELRSKIESALELNSSSTNSVVNPARALLKLYHDDVETRCELFFSANNRAALAREIHAKMVELDPMAKECSPNRVQYWLALHEGDTRPHAAKDSKFFKIFCQALQINSDSADQYWKFIRNARALNQHLGRELSARYSEVLFAPESAITYRKVSEETVKQLQQDALQCVDRVTGVTAPLATAN